MEDLHTNPKFKQSALRYAQLQLRKKKKGLNQEEEGEMNEILTTTGLSHVDLIKIATNDIVAE